MCHIHNTRFNGKSPQGIGSPLVKVSQTFPGIRKRGTGFNDILGLHFCFDILISRDCGSFQTTVMAKQGGWDQVLDGMDIKKCSCLKSFVPCFFRMPV
jgi:hypothetical protein